MFFSSSITRFNCIIALLTTVASGQTVYSPGGVGTVGADSQSGSESITADIFAWDLNANATSNYDTYSGKGRSILAITGSGGEFFRVILGPSVDINNAFWNTNQTWSGIISANGNAIIPNLSQANVSAGIDTSVRGSFSLSGNVLTWTALPEPTTALVGLLVMAGFLRRRR